MTPDLARVALGGMLAVLVAFVGYRMFLNMMRDREIPKMIVSHRQREELEEERKAVRKRNNFLVNVITLGLLSTVLGQAGQLIGKGKDTASVIRFLVIEFAIIALARFVIRLTYPKDPPDPYL